MTEELLNTSCRYFRFADEAEWIAAAKAAGFYITVIGEEGVEYEVLQAYTSNRAIDVIGTLYNNDAVYDDEDIDKIVKLPTAMAGFHVNFIGALPEGWDAFEVTPEQPKRVFAS
tara:strand:- start:3041 stop:3382 length:342 start_codon:yes stop_codon:yes gene_type:complete